MDIGIRVFERLFRKQIAMSFDRQKVKKDFEGLKYNILEHLLKRYLMPSHIDYSHWGDELTEWIFNLSELRIKPDDQKLRKKDIKELLFTGPFTNGDILKRRLNKIAREYKVKPIDISSDDLWAIFNKIYDKLALMLGRESIKDLEYDDVEEFIKNLKFEV